MQVNASSTASDGLHRIQRIARILASTMRYRCRAVRASAASAGSAVAPQRLQPFGAHHPGLRPGLSARAVVDFAGARFAHLRLLFVAEVKADVVSTGRNYNGEVPDGQSVERYVTRCGSDIAQARTAQQVKRSGWQSEAGTTHAGDGGDPPQCRNHLHPVGSSSLPTA